MDKHPPERPAPPEVAACQLASAEHTIGNAPSSPPAIHHDYVPGSKDLRGPPAPLVFMLRLAALLLCVDTLLIISSSSPGTVFLLRGLNCVIGAVLCFRAATRLETSHQALESQQQEEEAKALAAMLAAPKSLSFSISPTRSRTRPFLFAMMEGQDRAGSPPGAGRHHGNSSPSPPRCHGPSASLGNVGDLEGKKGTEGKEDRREEVEEEALDSDMDCGGSGAWGQFNSGEEGGRDQQAGSFGDAVAAAAAAAAAPTAGTDAGAGAGADAGTETLATSVNCNKKLTLLLCLSAVLLLVDAGWIFWVASTNTTTTYPRTDPSFPPAGGSTTAPPSGSSSLRQHPRQSSSPNGRNSSNVVYGALLYVIGLLCVFASCASASAARRLWTYGSLLMEGERMRESDDEEGEEVLERAREREAALMPRSASKCVSFEGIGILGQGEQKEMEQKEEEEEEEEEEEIVGAMVNAAEEGEEEGKEGKEEKVQCMAIEILDCGEEEEKEEEDEEGGEGGLDDDSPLFPSTPSSSVTPKNIACPRSPLDCFSAIVAEGGGRARLAAAEPHEKLLIKGEVDGLLRRCASVEDQRRLALLLTTTAAGVAGSISSSINNSSCCSSNKIRRCASFVDFSSTGNSSHQRAMGRLANPLAAQQPTVIRSASSPSCAHDDSSSNSSNKSNNISKMLTPAVGHVPRLTPVRV